MTRLIGWLMTLVGGIAALWGLYHVMTGQSSAQFVVTESFRVTALVAGLAGVATFTMGLIWARD